MSDDASDKPHDPTPKRKEDARKKGRFAKARDAGAVATISASLLVFSGMRDRMGNAIDELFRRTHGDLTAIGRGEGTNVLTMAMTSLATLAAPIAIAAVIFAIAVGFAQAGIRIDMEILKPKAENMDPIAKLKQVFSPKRAMFETMLAFLKVGVVGSICYSALIAEIPELARLATIPISSSIEVVLDTSLGIVIKALGGLAAIAAVDYAHNRWTTHQDMKMSHQELKDEFKHQDGDPKLKGRMRARARELAKKRMMSDVKTATVIVTNPTHVSVALRYGNADPAPMVVAKGHDEVALAIRTEARKHGIPIIESRKLARALDAQVKIGHPIPIEHFAAVAEILAFVYRILKKRPA